MKLVITLAAAAAAVLATGCSTIDKVAHKIGVPISTNVVEKVVYVDQAGLPLPVPQTNFLYVTNLGLNPEFKRSVDTIGSITDVSGIPWVSTLLATGTTTLSLFLAAYNRRQKQRLGVARDINEVLIENVEEMKQLVLEYAKQLKKDDPNFVSKVNEFANEVLRHTQRAADVEEEVAKLVNAITQPTLAAKPPMQ